MIYKIAHMCIIRFYGMILNVKWRGSKNEFEECLALCLWRSLVCCLLGDDSMENYFTNIEREKILDSYLDRNCRKSVSCEASSC